MLLLPHGQVRQPVKINQEGGGKSACIGFQVLSAVTLHNRLPPPQHVGYDVPVCPSPARMRNTHLALQKLLLLSGIADIYLFY